MSFQLNSDREQLVGVDSTIIGTSSVRIRSGAGEDQREIFQAKIDNTSGLPRVGINRTGRRVDSITVTSAGLGYTDTPTINISAPTLPGGIQAVASAVTDSNGRIISIGIDNQGDGYEFPPTVTITGGNGSGAAATSALDTIDFELDVNGAIRTSTSIISDTANILNLDIDNLVTPDVKYRAADFKTWANGTGVRFPSSPTPVNKNDYFYEGSNIYQALDTGITGLIPPFHEDGIELNGDVRFKHIGYRVNSPDLPFFGESGDSGIFPRSITPLLGDRSDKVATTEYVLNLATNDVGGRIYVSEQIGDDDNDGRSPVNPVRTIKRACQLAWETPGVKESIIIAGGEYLEDNPISIPPDASIVGDNLRLVIIRPENIGKHIFKFGDKNYVIGVTYQDKVNSSGASVGTWDFAMVFDDKQRIIYDKTANGDFGTNFTIGHQFFGPDSFQALFSFNDAGLTALSAGITMFGANTGTTARVGTVEFDINDPQNPDAYKEGRITDLTRVSGAGFQNSETFYYGGTGTTKWAPSTQYQIGDIVWSDAILPGGALVAYVYTVTTAGISGTVQPTHTFGIEPNGTAAFEYTRQAYSVNLSQIESTRAEGEVVFTGDEYETVNPLPITRIDFSLQGTFNDGFQNDIYGDSEDLGGIVFYTNPLEGANNIHDFKEGEEIEITGMPSAPDDLSFLNGKHRIYKVIEDADGRARRFVLPKKLDPALNLNEIDDWDPDSVGAVVSVKTYSKSVTLSLLNSPNKFPVAQPVARRYQDACLLIRNNINYIADEVVRKINDQFKKEYFSVYEISGNTFKIYLGTSRFAHNYVNGGTVRFNNTNYSITNFEYDHDGTGEATITTATNAGLSEDDTVKLSGIVVSCIIDGVVTEKTYPSFNIPVSDQKCRRDIGHFLNAIIQDLEFGSNYNTINAARKYFAAGQVEYVDYEIIQTVRAIEYARELAIYAMRKWRTGNGTPVDPVYVSQYTSLDQYVDPTVIDDPASPACANVASAINTLSYLFVDIISNQASGTYLDGAYLIARNRDFIADEAYQLTKQQYPSLGLDDVDERKCRRDINYILSGVLRDLVLGGNAGSVNAAEFYFQGTTLTGVPASELGATRFAFTKVRDLSILAMRNWYQSGGAGSQYTPLYSIIPQFTDNTILVDPAGTPWCADVEASLTTSFELIDGILEFADDNTSPTAIQPGSTVRTTGTLYSGDNVISYPDNVLRDVNNNFVTIRAVYDDLPIISASPYTQNASIISKLGGSGALIDGSKVKNPNCPFPGLSDGRATFPNQGKSMVASAFTIVSEQNGIGYKIIEDGYVQLVSVFCIFCVDGILAESGGYASVTNSASNFGTYALRSRGYRREPYEFDSGYTATEGYQRAFIDVVSESITQFTEFTIDNIGRIPLEHYIVKVDGYESADLDDEYFIDKVEVLREGPPYRARITVTSGSGAGVIQLRNKSTGLLASPAELTSKNIALHRPSIVNSSSHTWEFVGSGVDYNALPENGGLKIDSNEQVSEDYGRTYVSGTDELGDFKVGTFAKIENRTGNITFTGTVSISEVEFLKLRGGDVVVTGFDNSNTLGGALSSDSKLPTQKAVRDYIINNLGQYLNKNYSTNPVPRALVELTDEGKISESQLPASSPIEVYSVDTEQERLSLEGVNAGDIVIESGAAYILNTDSDSLFLGINVDSSLQFTVNDIFTGSTTNGKIQLTEYRPGVIKTITVTDPGSGYSTSNPPTVVINDNGTQIGHVPAVARAIVAGGEIVAIELVLSDSYIGGKGYLGTPTISFTNTSGGAGATATVSLESRLYGDIVNNIKIEAIDTIQSSDVPAETVDVIRVVNTSGSNPNNWVSLNTQAVQANAIEGVIGTGNLAENATLEANSNTVLYGDSSYKKVVKSFRGTETRYFIKTAEASGADYLVFESTSNNQTGLLLEGHSVTNVTGVQAGTTITQIATFTVGQTTYKRVTLSDGLTSSVPVGTVVEFIRPASPVLIESNLRTSGAIESVQIENGGSGFAADEGGNFTYSNVAISGGGGTGLELTITVADGVVTNVVVANSGKNYPSDFTISPPTEIGTGGSGLILRAKRAQVDKQEGDIGIDIARATSDTLSDEEYGTVGVVRLRKSQFDVGPNGSVRLYTGIDSGLDADLLDGNQSGYYRNADNINQGRLKPAYLSGEYNIDITGESANTVTLSAKTGSLTSDLDPNDFVAGITADVRRNDANQLFDPATKVVNGVTVSTATDYNTVLSFRGGGTGTTNPYGGVGQIAFTNGNNFYARGSSGRVDSEAAFSAWAKIWTSQNDYRTDPADSRTVAGPNAYRLRNRTGKWYQNANTFIYGDLGDRRIPSYQTQKDFNNRVRILRDTGAGLRYDVLITDVSASVINAFDNPPFTSNPPLVKILDALGNDPGEIRVSNIEVYNVDGTIANTSATNLDYTNLYAIVTGTLEVGGNFTGGVALGDNTVQVPFADYSISTYDGNADGMPDGSVEVIRLENATSGGRIILGRSDGAQGSASTPEIWFRTSQAVPADTSLWYTAGLKASGGNENNGSGVLDVLVTSPNAFTIGSNVVWNQGNAIITATNLGSTYTLLGGVSQFNSENPDANVSVRSLVMRDEDGNFSAGTITANLTGTASGNLPIDGGKLEGGLDIGDSNSNADLNVYGNTIFNGNVSVLPYSDGSESVFSVDTDTLYVDGTNDRVGVNTATPLTPLHAYAFTSVTTAAGRTTPLDVLTLESINTGEVEFTGFGQGLVFRGSTYNQQTQRTLGRILHQINDDSIATTRGTSLAFQTSDAGNSTNAPTTKLLIHHTGNIAIGTTSDSAITEKLTVVGTTRTTNLKADTAVTIGINTGSSLIFNGGPTDSQTGGRNFRVGSNLNLGVNIFEISASTANGGTTWITAQTPTEEQAYPPALAIDGVTNRTAINTRSFGGTDNTDPQNPIQRNYALNVGGDVNINGQLFQNNAPFVTSRWTKSINNDDIWRLSRVGINKENPTYTLEIAPSYDNQSNLLLNASVNISGSTYVNGSNTSVLYANGERQYLDSYGVFKSTRNNVDENITIPSNTNAFSIGSLVINNGKTVVVSQGAVWTIV
jgi:hypothetical protein